MAAARTRTRRLAALAAAALVGAFVIADVVVEAPADAAPAADPVVRADGSIDAAQYRRMAGRLATAEGITFRFGAASTASTAGRPTAPKPADKRRDNHGTRPDTTYQVGGPQDRSKDDYSSNQGQVGYLSTQAKRTIGVDHVETIWMGEGVFSQKPQLSWTYFGAGHPEPDYTGSSAPARCMKQPGRFVAQARAYAHGEATANSLAVFDNGVVAAAGTNTARGQVCVQLPADLHPSAISVTNGNEFALVTAWNTRTLTSELAVIALGGRQKAGSFWNYEWSELYPGFQNYGMPTFAKLLGTIELPMAAATAVSAVSDYSFGEHLLNGGGAIVEPGRFPLSNEANRQSFISGRNKGKRATAGYAVVASRSEKKTAFVDLQPLFSTITGAYFKDRASFTAAVGNVGKGADQWPRTFAAAPSERPTVVRTISTKYAPTAVAAMLSGKKTPRAYVATENGRLRVYGVAGLATVANASAASVVYRGAIAVGENSTGITYVKDRETSRSRAQTLDNTLIVTARGARTIQWVRLSGAKGSVIRTLRDSRLVDPIAAEDNNTHGTESYVVSIADYGARRLLNYRYGDVVLHTNGGAVFRMRGGGPFEFGGAYDPKGRPFSISVTNVT